MNLNDVILSSLLLADRIEGIPIDYLVYGAVILLSVISGIFSKKKKSQEQQRGAPRPPPTPSPAPPPILRAPPQPPPATMARPADPRMKTRPPIEVQSFPHLREDPPKWLPPLEPVLRRESLARGQPVQDVDPVRRPSRAASLEPIVKKKPPVLPTIDTTAGQPPHAVTIEALARISARPGARPEPTSQTARRLRSLLRDRVTLRAALVANELLGPPLALRDEAPGDPWRP